MEAMNSIGSIPGGGNCRLSLTDEDKAARDLLAVWMHDEGLEIKIDELGNMFGIRAGKSTLPALAIDPTSIPFPRVAGTMAPTVCSPVWK